MSANFNIAMLRSIQQPLADSMEAIISQLTRLLAGQIQGNELDQQQHAKLVRGSLEMIGCQAISRLAATLEKGCEALVMPDRRGWDRARVEQVGKALLLLAEGLDEQIKHMLVDNEDLPVRLWPVWAYVYETMGEPAPTPEDLFEPDPNFDDEKFRPLANDYLAQVCEGMSERLGQAIGQLDAARDGSGVAKALREAERVFNWAYGLRHRRGYQAYWLVMRARMAMGLIQDPANLEDKASWSVLLNEASIELQKFAKDSLRVRPDLLLKVIRPLLAPWPQSWIHAHPALSDMDARMGLSVFWRTVEEVQDQKSQLAVTQFVAHQEELLGLLSRLRAEWTRYVSGEGRASDPVVARGAVSSAVQQLNAKRMLFSDPAAIVMLEAIHRVTERLPPYDQVTEEMALEYASSVLVVEDSVERRGRVSPEFHEQSRVQQKRLMLAWEGSHDALAAMPIVRWDAKKQERQTRQALSTVFQEIHKDLASVEEMLVDYFRGEAHKALDRNAMRDTLSLADAVLRMLMCGPASRVVGALLSRLEALPMSGPVPQALQDDITLGITGLTSFIGARESGNEDAESMLAGAVMQLLGEPLRQGLDPSFLVPPPEQDVVLPALVDEPQETPVVERVQSEPVQGEPLLAAEQLASDAVEALEADLAHSFDDVDQDLNEQELVAIEPVEAFLEDMADETVEDAAVALSPLADDLLVEAPAAEGLVVEDAVFDGAALEPKFASSESDLATRVIEGMWDTPSEKEPDLVNFLLDESDSVLMEILLQAGALEHDPTDTDARASLRRQFHTIKGSGRIAGLVGMAEVAWWIEQMLHEDEEHYPVYRPRVAVVVDTARQQFVQWFSELRSHKRVWLEAGDLRQDIQAVALFDEAPVHRQPEVVVAPVEPAPEIHPTVEMENFSLDALSPSAPSLQVTAHDGEQADPEEAGLDQAAIGSPQDMAVALPATPMIHVEGAGAFEAEMFALFEEDASFHVQNLRACIATHASGNEVDVVLLHRAAHTSASLVASLGIDDVKRLARAIEHVLEVNPEDPPPPPMIIPDALAHATAVLAAAVESIYMERRVAHVGEEIIASVNALGPTASGAVMYPELPDAEVQAVVPEEVGMDLFDVNDPEGDQLMDEIIDKMADIAEKLQEATALLIKLSERRR